MYRSSLYSKNTYKNIFSSHIMYNLSKFLLRVWQCFFIAPVLRRKSGVSSANKLYAFSTLWYVMNLCVLCLCLAVGLCAVMDDLNASKMGRSLRMQNTSSAVVTVLQVTLMSIVCVLSVTGSAGRHQVLLEIGQQLEHVDAVLAVSCHAGQAAMVWFAFTLLSFHAVLFTMDGYWWYTLSPASWMYFVCYIYLIINLAALFMYAQIAWSIGLRFQQINVVIERKLTTALVYDGDPFGETVGCYESCSRVPMHRQRKFTRKTEMPFVVTENYFNDMHARPDLKYISIAKLQELHWSLCNNIKMVNDQFGWQLFLQLFCNCVQLIVTPYFMIMDLFYPVIYGSTDIKFILIQVVWVLTHVSHLLLITLPTSYATTKGEKTAEIICKYLTIDAEPNDMRQLEIFVLQLHKYTIEFSACGVIHLHRSTITTIIGTAVTYLVILIQFQNSD